MKLVRGKNVNDKRFINMTRVQFARRYGVKIGFKGLDMMDEDSKPENVGVNLASPSII